MNILKKFASIATLTISLTTSVSSQEARQARFTGGVQSVTTDGDFVISRTLILRPQIAEQALSSRLFPSADKLRRGTAAQIYLRMTWEAGESIRVLERFRGEADQSLEELDLNFVAANTPLRWSELKRAAYRERAEWEYPIDEVPWVDVLLPDIQQSRSFHYAIVSSARADILRGEISAAEEKIAIAFAFAKHIGESPFIVARIIQFTQCDHACSAVEELVQHPSSPNYFWDLTSLPKPMIDIRSAIQFESVALEKTFPELSNLERLDSDHEWQELQSTIFNKIPEFAEVSPDATDIGGRSRADLKQAMNDWPEIARKRLPAIDKRFKDKMDSMCDAEASVRYLYERSRQLNRQRLAVSLLEPHVAVPRSIVEDKRMADSCADEQLLKFIMLGISNGFIRRAWELDQKFAMLRVVESIRDWSGRNDGKLPTSLDDLTLPIPEDCLTNKPFRYELSADGKSADVRSGKVPYAHGSNEQTHVRYLHYHLTLE